MSDYYSVIYNAMASGHGVSAVRVSPFDPRSDGQIRRRMIVLAARGELLGGGTPDDFSDVSIVRNAPDE